MVKQRISDSTSKGGSMAKFKMRLKVTGIELGIEGERQDIPAITAAVTKQFAAVVEPIDVITETKQLTNRVESQNGDTTTDEGKSKRKRAPSNRTPAEFAIPVEYRHDAKAFGAPQQAWSILEKAIWMLWVLQNTGTKEYMAGQIVATFNQNFKAAGRLHPPLVPRELQKAKVLVPTPVGEDKERRYPTEEGERQAQQLVAIALGQ
jgi:hypothetical protein